MRRKARRPNPATPSRAKVLVASGTVRSSIVKKFPKPELSVMDTEAIVLPPEAIKSAKLSMPTEVDKFTLPLGENVATGLLALSKAVTTKPKEVVYQNETSGCGWAKLIVILGFAISLWNNSAVPECAGKTVEVCSICAPALKVTPE